MKLASFALVVALGLSLSAHAQETTLRLEKKGEIWKKALCTTDEGPTSCGLPQSLGLRFDIQGDIARPSEPGRVTQLKQTFRETPFRVDFALFWARPIDETKPDYLVTQIRFSHETNGLLAECSRYNPAELANALSIGSCAGVMNGEQVGVSVSN